MERNDEHEVKKKINGMGGGKIERARDLGLEKKKGGWKGCEKGGENEGVLSEVRKQK